MARLRHIPTEGEYIVESGYRFTVVQATERGGHKIKGGEGRLRKRSSSI